MFLLPLGAGMMAASAVLLTKFRLDKMKEESNHYHITIEDEPDNIIPFNRLSEKQESNKEQFKNMLRTEFDIDWPPSDKFKK
ncbi:hypothetical protein [Bacillus sp. 3255]|uniref:hypothetical protein n=1 Tax=Bacillus sp. 3255 TaxID=2817904 RepID=UPI00286589B1|nr:hypothetical protein [Bacillus sp. 3255]MDR6884857.1 hypothetical protein [Bacillus sp. 3255]